MMVPYFYCAQVESFTRAVRTVVYKHAAFSNENLPTNFMLALVRERHAEIFSTSSQDKSWGIVFKAEESPILPSHRSTVSALA